MKQRFTPEEDAILVANYGKMSREALLPLLPGRSKGTITNRAWYLGLTKKHVDLSQGERPCNSCGHILPLTEEFFHKHSSTTIGFRGVCKECRRDEEKVRRAKYPDKYQRTLAKRRHTGALRKRKLISHYSNGHMCCACCGEMNLEFLSIDHINGGGNQHRREVGRGTSFYLWLIRQGFPTGFRVLCHNCNQSIGYFGYCPHQTNHYEWDVGLAATG
jgi:hypothetical protein